MAPDFAAVKPVSEWPVRIGGLMRCCTETLRVDAGWAKEGQVINCLYCPSAMRLRDGAWEWNPKREYADPGDCPCEPRHAAVGIHDAVKCPHGRREVLAP
jgi:hypothetical protein